MLAASQASAKVSFSVSEHSKTVFSTVQLVKFGAEVSSSVSVAVSVDALPQSSVIVYRTAIVPPRPQVEFKLLKS